MLIKICGLTDKKEVQYLKENKVDFAGMVLFYEKSKRNISINQAKEILGELAPDIKSVAVTVSPSMEQVKEIEAAGFDYIQIHGSVDDDIISGCSILVFKAFNVEDTDKYEHYLTFDNIKGFVFDAGKPGSGKTFDWNMLKKLDRKEDKLYILAGGLNESNVKEAIEFVKPDGVDVSSGVELEDVVLDDGRVKTGKDPAKIEKFVSKVRM
ncbi:MAG: phosphoribosylanthranilate isomerase [Lachnospiraceae bacterium]|nr:phosphoribosylanthranilate isomerase [Lachnospiraceae bacterium]